MTYTQSPQLTSQEIEAFLEEAKTARFCSMNKDGTIHAAPVWFEYKNGQTLTATPEKIRKTRNVRRNKNVTVLVDVEGPPTRGVIVYGNAELEYLDDPLQWAVSLFKK